MDFIKDFKYCPKCGQPRFLCIKNNKTKMCQCCGFELTYERAVLCTKDNIVIHYIRCDEKTSD